MTVKRTADDAQAPRKRAKLDANSRGTYRYSSAGELRASLKNQNQDALVEALTSIRNQLTIKPNEGPIAPQDARLTLAQSWLETSPGAHDIFEIWEVTSQRQLSILSLLVSVLAALLNLTSSHYSHHAHGHAILKTLLSQQWMQQLNTYVAGSHNDLIINTLKLLNAMSSFAAGSEKKAVFEGFAWEIKSLPKLLSMRRRGKDANSINMLARPDIRTLYILFILSFVDTTAPTFVKAAFLDQRRDTLASIFKGVNQDSYTIIRRILEVCWAGIWSDAKIKRTAKINIFNEGLLSQLIKLYERSSSEVTEGSDEEQIPADLVHHFLLAICTRPGTGICFRDRGWYPRESQDDARPTAVGGLEDDDGHAPTKGHGNKIYNKVLANVVKTLRVNEDPRQQELAIKILGACPELVAGYWASAAPTLEPRLSSKWISNISFLGSIISLPIPPSPSLSTPSTQTSTSTALYQPTPPPLNAILENILPSLSLKAHLSKGLQSNSPLVQHCTALALCKCLMKYEKVLEWFREVEGVLEEDVGDAANTGVFGGVGEGAGGGGQWSRRRREVEREVRKRVPDFQVVVAMGQHVGATTATPAPTTALTNETQVALLAESSTRLLWLYNRCLPSLVAEARFDVGKLLQHLVPSPTTTEDGDSVSSSIAGLRTLRQLHVLRLLKENEGFSWTGKTGSRTHLSTLLKSYTTTPTPSIRTAISSLLSHVLSSSILFAHDSSEVYFWMSCLPSIKRAPGAEAPDGTPLTNEDDAVIAFLDECVQRSLKAPHRYIEEMESLTSGAEGEGGDRQQQGHAPDTSPSPLLMTVREQLLAKLLGHHFTPSDALAVTSFVRRLVLVLASKLEDLGSLERFTKKIVDSVSGQISKLFEQSPLVSGAIRREVEILKACLQSYRNGPLAPQVAEMSDPAVQKFLGQLEELPIPTSPSARQTSAYELVDWIRLLECTLTSNDIARLVSTIEKLHPSALIALVCHIDPRFNHLLDEGVVKSQLANLHAPFLFHWLNMQWSLRQKSTTFGGEQLHALFNAITSEPHAVLHAKAAITSISHRMSANDPTTVNDAFTWAASVMEYLKRTFTDDQYYPVVEHSFALKVVKDVLATLSVSSERKEVTENFVKFSLDSRKDRDREIVAPLVKHLAAVVPGHYDQRKEIDALNSTLHFWVPYMDTESLLELFDFFASSTITDGDEVIRAILTSLTNICSETEIASHMRSRFPPLFSLLNVDDQASAEGNPAKKIIALIVHASLPVGLDGLSPAGTNGEPPLSLTQLISKSTARWERRMDDYVHDIEVETILSRGQLSSEDVEILSGLVYSKKAARVACYTWLSTETSTQQKNVSITPLIYATLDEITTLGASTSVERVKATGAWKTHFENLVRSVIQPSTWSKPSDEARDVDSVIFMLSCFSESREELIGILRRAVEGETLDVMSAKTVLVARRLLDSEAIPREETIVFVASCVDHGLQWASRHFASDEALSAPIVQGLTALIKADATVKTHFVDPVLTAAIQHRLSDPSASSFATVLVKKSPLKPLLVNRHLQSILQHPSFHRHASPSSPARQPIISLLHTLFHLHPSNTCQPSHVLPLTQIYGGTLSSSDLQIFAIFKLFEESRKTSVAGVFSQWSSSPGTVSENSLEALDGLDSNQIFRTCMTYPSWRKLGAVDTREGLPATSASDEHLYDPLFILLLVTHVFASSPPSSAAEWVQLFRTNAISLVIRMLSSKEDALRDVAMTQVAAISKASKDADMQEKLHVIHIFDLLRDAIRSSPETDTPPRLPTFTTLLLAHSLRGIFYPANFIYPLTSRFLLQRPELDSADVPMLFSMLYSSSEDWKKERGWMVKFLADAMLDAGEAEWKVFRRRHTWDLLASAWQSGEGDRLIRHGVQEVVLNITSSRRMTTSLTLKSALLPWIEMVLQSQSSLPGEAVYWLKIAENILMVADARKFESATGGQWRATIARCLQLLLQDSVEVSSELLSITSRILLRLSLLPGPIVPNFGILMAKVLTLLQSFEHNLDISHFNHTLDLPPQPAVINTGPHTSYTCSSSTTTISAHSVQIWGRAVEEQWRSAMGINAFEGKGVAWGALSARILLWRSMVGRESSKVGEWVRREVLAGMNSR